MVSLTKFEDRLKQVKFLGLDVDGVLTSGELYYNADGEALKVFNVKDGLGLKVLQGSGVIVAIISARSSPIVAKRMEELGIKYVYQGVENKLSVIEGLMEQFSLYWENIAYMGDDLADLDVLKRVGFPACPQDAVLEVSSICQYITRKNGGNGAVREFADLILKYKNKN